MLVDPGVATFDVAITKQFPLPFGKFKDSQSLAFRAEFFNFFNRANFGTQAPRLFRQRSDGITSAGDPRITQLSGSSSSRLRGASERCV
jgi:hypothetical protein